MVTSDRSAHLYSDEAEPEGPPVPVGGSDVSADSHATLAECLAAVFILNQPRDSIIDVQQSLPGVL